MIFLLFLLTIARPSFGNDIAPLTARHSVRADPCTNLAGYACGSDTTFLKDGTGSTGTPIQDAKAFVYQLNLARKRQINWLVKQLTKPQNSKLLQQSYISFGINEDRQCPQPATCSEKIASVASMLVERNIYDSFPFKNGLYSEGIGDSGNLATWSEFMDSTVYKEAEKRMKADFDNTIARSQLANSVRENVFPKLKEILKAKINAWVANPTIRKKMIEKVDNIQWSRNNCVSDNEGFDVMPQAYYHNETTPPTVEVCQSFFMNLTSMYTIATTLSHELAHSIDPCRIAKPYKTNQRQEQVAFKYMHTNMDDTAIAANEYPLGGLISCLQSSDSVKAYDPAKMWVNRFGAYIDSRFHSHGPVTQPFCDFDQNDQIGEAVADWIGVDVAATYLKSYSATPQQRRAGYANAYRSLCGIGAGDHPATADRINRIIMVNPLVRQQMGCGPLNDKITYCSIRHPKSILSTQERSESK